MRRGPADARDPDDVRAAVADPENRERIGWGELKGHDHRILYSIEDVRLLILVVKIGHRRDRLPLTVTAPSSGSAS